MIFLGIQRFTFGVRSCKVSQNMRVTLSSFRSDTGTPDIPKINSGEMQALVIVLGSVTRHFSIFLLPTPSLVDISAPSLVASESLQNFVFLGPEDHGDRFEV